MSLVAYGSSDDETSSDESDSPAQPIAVAPMVRKPLSASLPKPKNMNEDDTEEEDSDEGDERSGSPKASLFAALPAPKQSDFYGPLDEGEVEVPRASSVAKRVKGPVKISVPALSQFEGDDKEPKRKVPKAAGSGLFAVLPPPKRKGATSLLPYVLQKKPAAPTKPAPKPTRKTPTQSANLDADDKEEASSSTSGDFFSLNSGPETFPELPPEDLEREFPALRRGGNFPEPTSSEKEETVEGGEGEAGSSGTQQVEEDEVMDEAAILRLHGKRRRNEPINIIDISADAIIPDAKEWLLKQLTEEKHDNRSHSHKKKGNPTAQQRRKHQITYLAFEAKERELELKNQWAQNRMTRKQTQLKYGF